MTQTIPSHDHAGAGEVNLEVGGMSCASCVAHVEKAARKVPGVQEVSVNLARGRAAVKFDPREVSAEQIAGAISDSGYPAAPEHAHDGNAEEQRVGDHAHHSSAWGRRALIGTLLWLPVELTHWILLLTQGSHAQHGVGWMTWVALVTSTIAIVYVGWGFYVSAFKALLRKTSNMDTLIAMGASVAYGYSLVALVGYLAGAWRTLPNLYFMEAAGLLALISIGHWLEGRARDSAGSAIRELLNLAPATALRVNAGDEGDATVAPTEVPVAELNVGDRVLVRPGDRVATDGVVIAGRSSVNESMITGESLPVLREVGDEIIGGTVNTDGRLIVRVSRVGSETALAQIVKLVDKAQSSKPPVQRLADQVAAVFVPVVLGISLITGIGWYIWGMTHDWSQAATWAAIANAVCSVLIIACPCALGLAVPAALMVGTGRGAKRGILIRDIDALQSAEKIETVVLDKTGTITQGKPIVTRVIALDGVAEDEVLKLAASAEQYSEHPLAKAIVAHAHSRGMKLADPEAFNNEPGLGVVARIAGQSLLVGNDTLLTNRGVARSQQADPSAGETLVHVGREHNGATTRLGVIALSDSVKSDSAAAVRELHDMKLRTLLLTGDNEATARAIAQMVGIEDVRANVRPDEKAAAVRELQERKSKISNQKSHIAMVGDGVNDAPALATADLGIAVGSASDVAKEAGDIVLVGHSLHGVAAAIKLSRATMRTIRQNLFFAFIYNVLAIPLAALGLLNPLIAAAAMALSDVTVIGNALRLRRARID